MDVGYAVYDANNPSRKFYFDKAVGKGAMSNVNLKQNVARTQLNTFGRVPYVYYAGKQNFLNLELSTVILAEYDELTGRKLKTALEVAEEFVALINNRRPLRVESAQGKVLICDVQITNYSVPKLYFEDDLEYVEVSIACLEIE